MKLLEVGGVFIARFRYFVAVAVISMWLWLFSRRFHRFCVRPGFTSCSACVNLHMCACDLLDKMQVRGVGFRVIYASCVNFFQNLYACDSAYYYHMIYMCMPGPSRNRGAGFRFRLTSDVFLHRMPPNILWMVQKSQSQPPFGSKNILYPLVN